jgi:hypothetical protein
VRISGLLGQNILPFDQTLGLRLIEQTSLMVCNDLVSTMKDAANQYCRQLAWLSTNFDRAYPEDHLLLLKYKHGNSTSS